MATATPSRPDVAPTALANGDLLYEVVNGQVVEKPMGAFETEIASILVEYLAPFVRANRLGKVLMEMLFRIDRPRDLQRRPDVAFVSDSRWPYNRPAPQEAVWDVVPDLAIEVVSPSNSANEVLDKLHEYFRAGVQRVWVVYPKTSEVYVYESPTRVYIFSRAEELDGGAILPGFRLPVAHLFAFEPQAG